jgi:hypothetical protein
MSEKKEPERAHLQDRPHPYCVRRPVATTATSYGLSWSERRAEQTRVGDRPGRFVPHGENPRGKKAPPYGRIAGTHAFGGLRIAFSSACLLLMGPGIDYNQRPPYQDPPSVA